MWFVRQVDAGTTALGYQQEDPGNAAMARTMERVPRSTLVASNDPWRIYAVVGRQPVELAPMKLLSGFSHRPMTVAALTDAVCHGDVVLVWFDSSPASGSRSIDTFERQATTVALTRLHHFADGTSYEVAPAGECA